ncbi:CoA-disulfide reductase [Peptoclostridium litorale DSM 5388]|uniref:Coenzyme A disulfide reductase Cdr n=1 Tax=Peptoclostridium litorale DSM 5388 TaxID=1121324 RepID=A0A069RHW8_PEPLI|nr:CoA-disulfide reductase [Peptoclostridium litorale]KDR96586.1 coenzyme A disulfide reductase Cdr [Peptoclostridium litorale DSM 5388]SIN68801.1 CoA-disulfide reductase [Peptoclostridium litorale DSM 5388]
MGKKIVIVGGVAGGATAAARLRRLDEQSHIVMFERGEYISFANCGLPYYIGETITERNALLVQTVEGMSKKFNLDIRNLSEVTKINRENKTVEVKNIRTGEVYEESYDKLILSPGANPIKPPIPGIADADNIFTLRNVPDTDAIKGFVDNNKPKKAVVVGGGFIGVEMAENLHDRGVHVTIVEMLDQIMAPVDFEMASILHSHIMDKGTDLVLGDGVKSFENGGKKVILQSGKEIDTDLIILSIGVRPENGLVKDAGLEIGERGGIKVSASLQTADEDIYAIGDAIEVTDFINGSPTMIPLAWPANRQGRIAADHIYGRDVKYPGSMGTSVAKVFDMTVAATGNNEKTLKRLGTEYSTIHIHPGSHAGYYPGAFPVSLKMTFDPKTGRIFGVQGVGYNGVEKRIDVVATAIKGGLTVFDLPDLELAYAPPYSSAKDPVNMLGYVASNVIEEAVKTVQWHEIDDIVKKGGLLVDVREELERDMGFIEGSINIPLGQLRGRLSELPKDKPVYITCQVGLRGYLAARVLTLNGYNAVNLDGGYRTYSSVFGSNSQNPESQCPVEVDDSGTTHPHCGPIDAHVTVNACGLQCPGPITKVYNTVNEMEEGQILEIAVTDPGFSKDIKAWCDKTGNSLLKTDFVDKTFKAYIQKGSMALKPEHASCSIAPATSEKEGATLVVFSGDMDKALASFIIASGAAAMGKKVTMFFTFWGLNVLRKESAPAVEKDALEKMFGMMMPKGPKNLPLSNMNMGGMGPKMIDYVMKKKNVDSLDTMIKNALDLGVEIVACAMSMDIMGIKEEEMIDGVEIGGVASYLGKTDDSGLNLFI